MRVHGSSNSLCKTTEKIQRYEPNWLAIEAIYGACPATEVAKLGNKLLDAAVSIPFTGFCKFPISTVRVDSLE